MNKYKMMIIEEKLKKDVYKSEDTTLRSTRELIRSGLVNCIIQNHINLRIENITPLNKRFDELKREYKKYPFITIFRLEYTPSCMDSLVMSIDYEKFNDYIYMLLEENE